LIIFENLSKNTKSNILSSFNDKDYIHSRLFWYPWKFWTTDIWKFL